MRLLRKVSIKNKIIVIVISVCLLILGLGFSLEFIYNAVNIKKGIVSRTRMNAKLIGEYCITALSFQYPERATEILEKLKSMPEILNGHVYDENSKLFASYNKTGETPAGLNEKNVALQRFEGDHLHVWEPIFYMGKKYGTIYLRALTPLSQKIWTHFVVIFSLMLVLLLLSYLFAIALQRIISRPILKLAEVSGDISKRGDYSLRAEKTSEDEIGVLYDEFNSMLGQIEKRDISLRESEERLKSILDNTTSVIYLKDTQSRYITINSQFEELFHITKERINGKTDFDLFQADVAEKVRANDGIALEQNGPVEIEEQIPQDDGFHTYISVKFPLHDAAGTPYAVCGISTDITERIQSEVKLKQYRDQLEELVRERTRELEDAHAEIISKERLAALGQLTATVAHEIRNPLGTIRTSVFSIGDAIEQNQMGRVERAIKLAERNIRRCDGIITELLDYTRKREMQVEPVTIDTWIAKLLDTQVYNNDVKCIRELHSGLIISIDPEHLRRAVINVFTNAVQALEETESEGKQVTVATRVSGGMMGIRISDNGPGIPEGHFEKIFEPLFSTKTFGVGLGLNIVRNIMEDHRGGVEIQSNVEEGTTIVLWLPISEGEK